VWIALQSTELKSTKFNMQQDSLSISHTTRERTQTRLSASNNVELDPLTFILKMYLCIKK